MDDGIFVFSPFFVSWGLWVTGALLRANFGKGMRTATFSFQSQAVH